MAQNPKIKEYVDASNAAFDAIDSALETANGKVTGIVDDVTFLKETIDKLNNNPGPISPEDQALLDAAQARVTGLVSKTTGVTAALAALDEATTRPEVPPA